MLIPLGIGKYLFVFLSALVVTYLLTPLCRRFGPRVGFIDRPGARHAHPRPTPHCGGIAVFLGVQAGCVALFFMPWVPFSGSLTVTYSRERQLEEVRTIVRNGFSRLLGKPVSEELAWAAREVWGGRTADLSVDLDTLASFVRAVYHAYVSYRISRSDKDLDVARSDTIRTLLTIEQTKQQLIGKRDIRLLTRAFQISPAYCIRSKQFMRHILNGTFVQALYRGFRRLAHL